MELIALALALLRSLCALPWLQRLGQELEMARDMLESAKRDAGHAASHAELAAKDKVALERDWSRRAETLKDEYERKIMVRACACMHACVEGGRGGGGMHRCMCMLVRMLCL